MRSIGGPGDAVLYELHRALVEDAVRAAIRGAPQASPLWVGRGGAEFCQIEGEAVRPSGVIGLVCYVDGVVRRGLIQIGRCARAIRPGVLVEPLAEDPVAGRGQPGALCHALQALGARGRLAVHHLQSEGIQLQVQVGIGQPGQQHLALQVLYLTATAKLRPQSIRGAYGQDLPAVDGEGRGLGLPAIQRVNPGVGEQNSGHRLCVDLRLVGCGLSDCAMCATSAQDSAGCTCGQAGPAGIDKRGVVMRFCPGRSQPDCRLSGSRLHRPLQPHAAAAT